MVIDPLCIMPFDEERGTLHDTKAQDFTIRMATEAQKLINRTISGDQPVCTALDSTDELLRTLKPLLRPPISHSAMSKVVGLSGLVGGSEAE